jgi:nucleoside-diphosphate-sugar epimerase
VHVHDLAAFVADLAIGNVSTAENPDAGPVAGGCTPVNVCTGSATFRDYFETVTGALGVRPIWVEAPAWTGQVLADRARAWGWSPTVELGQALAEIDRGLRG